MGGMSVVVCGRGVWVWVGEWVWGCACVLDGKRLS